MVTKIISWNLTDLRVCYTLTGDGWLGFHQAFALEMWNLTHISKENSTQVLFANENKVIHILKKQVNADLGHKGHVMYKRCWLSLTSAFSLGIFENPCLLGQHMIDYRGSKLALSSHSVGSVKRGTLKYWIADSLRLAQCLAYTLPLILGALVCWLFSNICFLPYRIELLFFWLCPTFSFGYPALLERKWDLFGRAGEREGRMCLPWPSCLLRRTGRMGSSR